jgi:hypothetical protein
MAARVLELLPKLVKHRNLTRAGQPTG